MSKFIVIEGGGGAGKTTQIEALKKKYPDALFVREPGGTVAGEAMRNLLFKYVDDLDPLAQLYLIHAARWQNIIENVAPALEQGQMVFCDRFQLSTYAYQVFPHDRSDLGEHMLETQAQFLNVGIKPYYLFLDIDPDQSMARIQTGREDDNDSFDEKGMEFQHLIHQGYKQGIIEMGIDCHVIDAAQSVEAVTADISEALNNIMNDD